jgi:hypothetical protein
LVLAVLAVQLAAVPEHSAAQQTLARPLLLSAAAVVQTYKRQQPRVGRVVQVLTQAEATLVQRHRMRILILALVAVTVRQVLAAAAVVLVVQAQTAPRQLLA